MRSSHRRARSLALALALSCCLTSWGQFESREERRLRLDSLAAIEKEQLGRKQERFEKLKADEQDKLRRLHTDLTEDDQGERLHRVMLRYTEWLKSLRSSERVELLSLAPEERVARIKQLIEEQERRRFAELREIELQPEDRDTIFKWMNQVVVRIEAKLISELSPPEREVLRRFDGQRHATMRRGYLLAKRRERMGGSPQMVDVIEASDEDIDNLQASLSDTARAALDEARSPAEKRELVTAWIRVAMMMKRRFPVSDAELQRYLREELEPADREFLENLPPNRMREELTRRYVREKFGRPPFRGGSQRRGEFRPRGPLGPGEGPPPRPRRPHPQEPKGPRPDENRR